MWFWNTIAEIGDNLPLSEVPASIEKWSYSKYDCAKYGLNYNTTFYPYDLPEVAGEDEYDVCFIGKDKGRLQDILSVKEDLEERGLRTYFHISPTHQYELFKNKIYQKKIPYKEVDSIISRSKCILDIEVSDTAGPTIRPFEALLRHKKLISNNVSLIDEDFYCTENVFILGKDSMDQIVAFIKSDYKDMSADLYDKYTMHSWVERFFKE